MTKNVAIALGLVSGLGIGLIGAAGVTPLHDFALAVAPLGTAFVKLIRLVVIPLVGTTLFSAIATMGDLRRLGKLGAHTLAFLWGTTLIAITTGMVVMALALPLAGDLTIAPAAVDIATPPPEGVLDFLIRLIPDNPVQAAADGALLPLIVFTVLFAAATATLPAERRNSLIELADAVTAALIKLVHWILWTAPVGVFALAAPVAAEAGLGLLRSLAVFVIAVIVGLIVFSALVYMPIVVKVARISGSRFLGAALEPAAIAFTTTSSVATLPALFEATDRLELPRPLASFVLPIAAAVNRSGSALYQGSAVIFLGHLYGAAISPGAYAAALLATFLVALTIAPVPSASVVTLPPALLALGVPLDGIGMLLGIDRIPDMFRTVVNVTGDVAAVAVVRRTTDGDPAP
ncbi:MAG: dicarboxylate/amino acid:cation symporter [Gemmatimonadota bacterium]|nr:dicarboxylate/amino acid:cation symporter [Gemmatimonadota bacterium]